MKYFVFLLLCSLHAFSADDELEQLKKRISDLEKQQEQILLLSAEPKPTVKSFLNDELTLGGFFDGGYSFISGPNTKTELVNDSNALGINLAAEFKNDYRFVSQFVSILSTPLQNEHNDSRLKRREYGTYTTLSVVTQGYIEKRFSRKFNVQGGLGYVPFGYSLQLREPVLYVRRGGPQIVRGDNLVSPLWSGVHFYGSTSMGEHELGYNLYTFTPTVDSDFAGLGGRVWGSSYDDKLIGGISMQTAKKNSNWYEILGADLRFEFDRFQVRTEIAKEFAEYNQSWSTYLEPGYFLIEEELLLYVFGDFLSANNYKSNVGNVAVPDPVKKWEYGAGLNWLPTSFTRIRLGFTFYDYVLNRSKINGINRDYFGTDVSVGVAF